METYSPNVERESKRKVNTFTDVQRAQDQRELCGIGNNESLVTLKRAGSGLSVKEHDSRECREHGLFLQDF